MKFSLDDASLRRLFEAWSVPAPARGLVLFAFRGCVLSGRLRRGWSESVGLETAEPDFTRMRCVVGVWDRDARRLFVAPGSTVPHRDNVLKAAARRGAMQGRGTNQLEPGYYTDLTKGEHLQGKPQGHAALRQTGFRFYRRARHAPPYTDRDPLYFGNPYDNLHCAWNRDASAPGFRSAGCVVVAGWPRSPRLSGAAAAALPEANRNAGAWKTFHDLLYAAPQRTFPLLLLRGADAARAVTGAGEPARGGPRLVYGSEGAAVAALQKRLAARGAYAGRITGKLGASTYRAWKGVRAGNG